MDIVYGVSIGDYATGLYTRAYRNGITTEDTTLLTFEQAMFEQTDDRPYDATPEQWHEAYLRFVEGYARFTLAWEQEPCE